MIAWLSSSPTRHLRPGLLPVLLLLLCALWSVALPSVAAPSDVPGQWHALSPAGIAATPLQTLPVTGGEFEFVGTLELPSADRWVLDFRNGHVLGRFHHTLRDEQGRIVWQAAGGLQSEVEDEFALRHGRELVLPPGRYRLHTRLSSPYFIAPPVPYLDRLSHYRGAIQEGNALALAGIGLFAGLAFYYACLGLSRGRAAEALYAAFIVGNLLFNLASLGIAHDLFGIRWFHLSSVPILFSNIAYVAFVIALLNLRHAQPWLARTGFGVIGLLAGLALMAGLRPSWAMEACRLGVGLFLGFGLLAGVLRSRAGDPLARRYLVANLGFAIAGGIAITTADLGALYTVTVEHIGLVAVAIEVLLLALVLAYQFGQLQRDTARALQQAEHHLHLAHTDALTGLPNRYAFEHALAALPPHGGLSFIDLDGLKHFNDRHGHAEGDRLLRDFAATLQARLQGQAVLHRLAGDEFVALDHGAGALRVRQALAETVQALRAAGHALAGASCGCVRRHESEDLAQLQRLADERMYQDKRQRQGARDTAGAPPLGTEGAKRQEAPSLRADAGG